MHSDPNYSPAKRNSSPSTSSRILATSGNDTPTDAIKGRPSPKIGEECGVVGVYGCPEAAKLAYLSLYALQHRGQESAGIAASDGKTLKKHKSNGLVADAFCEDDFEDLVGPNAIGHVRYSTTGSSRSENAQPLLANYHDGMMAVAHNGNLTNADELRASLEKRGAIFQTSTDSEILLHLVAHANTNDFYEAITLSIMRIKGAYSAVVLRPDSLIAIRDPQGIRPLSLGRVDGGWIVASETCAMDILDAQYEREIEPGEIVIIDKDGLRSQKPFAKANPAFCVFENIYFSRPDSISSSGRSIYELRVDLGRELCREHPVEADVVVGVPDSAIPGAIGYSHESKIPYELGLIRNHYVGRTFIEPEQSIRDFGAKIKYNPVRDVMKGKRVVVVDDSIVRGTTCKKIVKMLRNAGASEIHVRSTAPPLIHPCYYGVDTPSYKELIAAQHKIPEICKLIDADTLGYLSIQGLIKVMPANVQHCLACFDGKYVAGKPENFKKSIMEK